MSEPPEGIHVADILIGTFMILFGLCIALAGGECTIIWLPALQDFSGRVSGHGIDPFPLMMLAISVGTLLLGALCVHIGIRTARGIYRKKRPDAEGGAGDGSG